MSALTIYLADDHKIVAQGVGALLKKLENVSDVFVFSNGKDLFDHCTTHLPDLALLDLNMPGWDGRKTLVQMRSRFPSVRCFILSMLNEKHIIEDCIQKGANGYLNKDCSQLELQEALLTPPGEIFYSKEVLKSLSGMNTSKAEPILTEPLSEREREILGHLCDGLTPKEIADKIFLSVRTIETHKNNIMQKFNVNSVGKLISLSIKNNLI